MTVQNTKRISEKISQLMSFRQVGNQVNAMLSAAINSGNYIPDDEVLRQLRSIAEEIRKSSDTDFDTESFMLIEIVQYMLSPVFQHDDPMLGPILPLILVESKVYDAEEFSKDPYIANINYDNHVHGDFEMTYKKYDPFKLGFYDAPYRFVQACIDIPRICCFSSEFRYPAIRQKSIKNVWMSVTPNEIETFKKPIENAKGKVLTLGCGMGYYAYMASRKEEVESVTIVEIEQSVIDLFEKHILPQFETKDKIKIVKADAIDFIRNMTDGEYDYCFADIWIGVQHIEPYFAVKEAARKLKKTKMEYWIEESFASFLSNYVFFEILKAYTRSCNISTDNVNDGIELSELDTRIRTYVKRLMKNVNITKPEEIEYYTNPKNIITLINKSKVVF